MPPPLIDDYLPVYDVAKRHAILIEATPAQVFDAVQQADFGASPVIRVLFALRGLPRTALTVEGMERLGFLRLGTRPNEELVLGLIGRFWTPSGDLQSVTPEHFRTFDRAGYAKAAWNFHVTPLSGSAVRLSTETRVRCLDDRSRFWFRVYWQIVGPFSGWIRRAMLRVIKRHAERAASP